MNDGFVAIGAPVPRIDGRAKVTGQARYAAEIAVDGLVHGVVVNATIARGRILAVHDGPARAVHGVLDVLWHGHRSEAPQLAHYFEAGEDFSTVPVKPLVSDDVHYAGQPVALVLAQTGEAARYAASLVRIEYEAHAHETDLPRHHGEGRVPKELDEDTAPPEPRGDADAAFAAAAVRVDAEFHQAVEHHNPIELHASTVIPGAGGTLTIHDKNQGGHGTRKRLAKVFGLHESQLTVLNTFVGGAFGSGLRPQYNVLLAMVGALHLRRPVRVVLTRRQMFTFGHRPEIWQRMRLGAARDGTLKALIHEAVGETSRVDEFTEMVTRWSGTLYRCENLRGDYRLLPLDLPTPLDMRAPGAASGLFPLEVAMDELAHALGMDPLALRLHNHAERAPSGDKPYSSKKLRECYALVAERFGWAARDPRPRSRREGDELWAGAWPAGSGSPSSRQRRPGWCGTPRAMSTWRRRPATSAPAPPRCWRKSRRRRWACGWKTCACTSPTRGCRRRPPRAAPRTWPAWARRWMAPARSCARRRGSSPGPWRRHRWPTASSRMWSSPAGACGCAVRRATGCRCGKCW